MLRKLLQKHNRKVADQIIILIGPPWWPYFIQDCLADTELKYYHDQNQTASDVIQTASKKDTTQ